MVLFFSFFLTLINLIFEHKIKPDPQIIVIRSIFSSKKINPIIVVNNNLEKSKDIKFVNFVILRAFVQQKFPSVAITEIITNKYNCWIFGVDQTIIVGIPAIGVINNTMLNIRVITDSFLDISFTNKPVMAWVIAAISARITPNFISKSGRIIMIVKINPRRIIKLFSLEVFSLKNNIAPR